MNLFGGVLIFIFLAPSPAAAADPDGDALRYTFTTSGGRLNVDGHGAVLDLAGAKPLQSTPTVDPREVPPAAPPRRAHLRRGRR